MPETPRHKVFISYYHDDDQEYKNRFAQMMEHNIVDRSVGDGDIDDQQSRLTILAERFGRITSQMQRSPSC